MRAPEHPWSSVPIAITRPPAAPSSRRNASARSALSSSERSASAPATLSLGQCRRQASVRHLERLQHREARVLRRRRQRRPRREDRDRRGRRCQRRRAPVERGRDQHRRGHRQDGRQPGQPAPARLLRHPASDLPAERVPIKRWRLGHLRVGRECERLPRLGDALAALGAGLEVRAARPETPRRGGRRPSIPRTGARASGARHQLLQVGERVEQVRLHGPDASSRGCPPPPRASGPGRS